MIKFKVTKPGVYMAVKGDQVEQEVGTVLTLECDNVPAFLVGKGEVVGDSDGKELVAADELLSAALAEIEAMTKANEEMADKLEKAEKAVADLTAEVADLKKKSAK